MAFSEKEKKRTQALVYIFFAVSPKKCHRLCIFIYLFYFSFFSVMLFMQTRNFPSVYTRRRVKRVRSTYFANAFRSLYIYSTSFSNGFPPFIISPWLQQHELSLAQFCILHLHHHDLSLNPHLYFLFHILFP